MTFFISATSHLLFWTETSESKHQITWWTMCLTSWLLFIFSWNKISSRFVRFKSYISLQLSPSNIHFSSGSVSSFFTLHHYPLLLEQVNQSRTIAACFGLDFLLPAWQINLLRPGLSLIVGTYLQVLGHGWHVLEAPGVHRSEQSAELPYLKSESETEN